MHFGTRSRLAGTLALIVFLGACTKDSPGAAGTEGAPSPEAVETEPEAQGGSQVAKDTYVSVSIGEPQSLDPAWTYETAGSGVEANVYESLLAFNKDLADDFVPALAESWTESEDHLSYTFNIRKGVTFHEGGTLTASDIAYSLQRAMLQDRLDGPMVLFLEPFLGVTSIRGYAVEKAAVTKEEATLADVPAESLAEVCEDVKAVVQSDDAAGTVTLSLMKPTPWMPQLLSQPWGSALDMEWMAEQGDWDGDCATWQTFHDPAAEKSILFNAANGTGPYKLAKWDAGIEIVLEANEAYWRTAPAWEGGPSGPPALKRVVLQTVDEWGTRLAKLQTGEADTVAVPRANIDQVEKMVAVEIEGNSDDTPATDMNPDGTLKLYRGFPSVSSSAAMFTFEVNTEGANEFIGSGKLDGAGIPADFFSDVHVRRGFSYCFDWDTYIAEALNGEGFQTRGPIIKGLAGYTEDNEIFSFDPVKCEEELALAWDGVLPETGFMMTMAYNSGNQERETVGRLLAEGLASVNPKYQVDVLSLEWASFLDARGQGKFPISISGWVEDYHHPSNWIQPFMLSDGAYARAQKLPEELQTEFDDLYGEAMAATDPAVQTEVFTQLQNLANEHAVDIWLAQATGRFYVNKAVMGWYNNPLGFTNYYAMSKEG